MHISQTIRSKNAESHQITAFFSFYSIPALVLDNKDHQKQRFAYLYHYAVSDSSRETLTEIIHDALVLAKQVSQLKSYEEIFYNYLGQL